MNNFQNSYNKLNPNQKKAVDKIDGPLMVVAGPGTGKTQLLTTRVANILQTNNDPSSILCLTYTESAATEMRNRLVDMIGQPAYSVGFHTFHSFGSEIIGTYPEFFFHGVERMPADDLATYQILESIFRNLPHSNPFASFYMGSFSQISGARNAIGWLKKAGLAPHDLGAILDANEEFIAVAETIFQEAMGDSRMSKKVIPQIEEALNRLTQQINPALTGEVKAHKSLATVFIDDLNHAIENYYDSQEKTPVMTSWRKKWFDKNNLQFEFKDRVMNIKLRALITIYEKYQQEMASAHLYDFDDMILEAIQAIKNNQDLKLTLQERYQYIMVDEFQDTNDAQLQLLRLLTDNTVNEDAPNIMAVGDDDQAIYRFQGAEVTNIIEYANIYPKAEFIVLTENYRSTQNILDGSGYVINQGINRLEKFNEEINKKLIAHKKDSGEINRFVFNDSISELGWVAKQIQGDIKAGIKLDEIAIIGRNHKHLQSILPHLNNLNIPVTYERRDNVLEQPEIQEILTIAKAIAALKDNRLDLLDELFPQILSFNFWDIPTTSIWSLAKQVFNSNDLWFDVALKGSDKNIKQVAEYILELARLSNSETLETMLDLIIGNSEWKEGCISPYKEYYFSTENFETARGSYLNMLSNLRSIRDKLREFRPRDILRIDELMEFVELHETSGTQIVSKSTYREHQESIHVLTAHKAKGREFQAVYIINCEDQVWAKPKKGGNKVRFPNNLPIASAGDNSDDMLRLFFVAITRSKNKLTLTSADNPNPETISTKLRFLESDTGKAAPEFFEPVRKKLKDVELIEHLESDWSFKHFDELNNRESKNLLLPLVENYQLNVSALNNFLRVTDGGPRYWLLQSMLRFPQANRPTSAFGTAVHKTLQYSHVYTVKHQGKPPTIKLALKYFKDNLLLYKLSERDYNFYSSKGIDILSHFYGTYIKSFNINQISEKDFKHQGVVIDGAHLSGKIDLIEVSKTPSRSESGSLVIKDYKTGKPHIKWASNEEYSQIKLHEYKNQLMFYKLLIENSKDFGKKYEVGELSIQFVEESDNGTIPNLIYSPSGEEMERFKLLVSAVYKRIQKLDLPSVEEYDKNVNGIIDFENSLIT